MKHGASGRRSRNRGGGRRGNQNRSRVFDSNGPDVRIRGTAHQIHEKYVALANDAAGSGDRILAESYLQHAEHYQRVINGWPDDVNTEMNESADHGELQKGGNRKPPSPARKKQEDDLGLPESIVGAGTKKQELEDA